jgi:hypothetical protein
MSILISLGDFGRKPIIGVILRLGATNLDWTYRLNRSRPQLDICSVAQQRSRMRRSVVQRNLMHGIGTMHCSRGALQIKPAQICL